MLCMGALGSAMCPRCWQSCSVLAELLSVSRVLTVQREMRYSSVDNHEVDTRLQCQYWDTSVHEQRVNLRWRWKEGDLQRGEALLNIVRKLLA